MRLQAAAAFMLGVEGLVAIFLITGDGIAGMRCVHADLMRAAGVDTTTSSNVAFVCPNHWIGRNSLIASFPD